MTINKKELNEKQINLITNSLVEYRNIKYKILKEKQNEATENIKSMYFDEAEEIIKVCKLNQNIINEITNILDNIQEEYENTLNKLFKEIK